jgi:hypothetical protein
VYPAAYQSVQAAHHRLLEVCGSGSEIMWWTGWVAAIGGSQVGARITIFLFCGGQGGHLLLLVAVSACARVRLDSIDAPVSLVLAACQMDTIQSEGA